MGCFYWGFTTNPDTNQVNQPESWPQNDGSVDWMPGTVNEAVAKWNSVAANLNLNPIPTLNWMN